MWEGVYGIGSSELNATISQNKGDEMGQKTTILVQPPGIERGYNNQPKRWRETNVYNQLNAAGRGRRGMAARTQQSIRG
eukprot:scaffold196871_cov36-Cyclotella_meneghiniana.AAC.1